jgi:hypothetical protein
MLKAAIGFDGLGVSFPADKILKLSLSRKTGEHSVLRFRGIAKEETLRRVTERLDGSQSVTLTVGGGDSPAGTPFTGVITSCAVVSEGDLHEFEATAHGHTILTDIAKRRRSFQNAETLHEELIEAVTEVYPGAEFILNAKDEPIKDMFVQYDETDFEFIKRVAGDLCAPVIPLDSFGAARFFVGLAEGRKPAEADAGRIVVENDVLSRLRAEKNGLPEMNAVRFGFESGEWFELGDPVKLKEGVFYVYACESETRNGLLLHTYTLRDANGFLEAKKVNERLAGISLFGTVTEVSKDRIALKLDIDAGNKHAGGRLFPYSTVYSSPDGSGFYFMPEKGDRVSLHFPSASEKEAYARSSADAPSADPARRSDPARKNIVTKHGKEILLTPDAVEIRSGAGSVCLYDNGGMEIRSTRSISLNAGGNVSIDGGSKFDVSGGEIEFSQGTGTYRMSGGNVVTDGEEVKVGE